MKTCETCKYWDVRTDISVLTLGQCELIPMWEYATEWNEECDGRVVKEKHKDCLAFAEDGSGYIAFLLTRPNFGCPMHEAK